MPAPGGRHGGVRAPVEADEPTEIISWRPLTPADGPTPGGDLSRRRIGARRGTDARWSVGRYAAAGGASPDRRTGLRPAGDPLSTTIETPPHSEAPLDREPGSGRRLRYMGRRRINRTDRNGDPLDGVVNLFDVAIILAVGFLLAALTGIGLTGILSSKNVTIVTNPGQPDMQVITKKGTQITKLNLKARTAGLRPGHADRPVLQAARRHDGLRAVGQRLDGPELRRVGLDHAERRGHAHATRRRDHPDSGYAADGRSRARLPARSPHRRPAPASSHGRSPSR